MLDPPPTIKASPRHAARLAAALAAVLLALPAAAVQARAAETAAARAASSGSSGPTLQDAVGVPAGAGATGLASPKPEVDLAPEAALAGYLEAESEEIPIVTFPSPAGELLYRSGRGLRVGGTGLTLGGYTSLSLERDEGRPAELTFDDLSFFVILDPAPRLHLFAELELEDIVSVDGDGHGGTPGFFFNAERVYGDFSAADWLDVRVGKFLTPVGRWNVIHAQPLVWTTSRPLATSLPFDRHTTGAALHGSVFPRESTVNYTVYGQAVNQLDPPPDEVQPADRSVGARLEYWRGTTWSVGASTWAFDRNASWQLLGGLDFVVQADRLQLMGEAVVEGSARDRPSQWGLYLQGVYEIRPDVFLVGRYEHYDQPGAAPTVNLFDPGLAWRPRPYLLLKAEYLIADHPASESPPGFKSSIAILF